MQRTIELFKNLIGISSPSKGEEKVRTYLISFFSSLGYEHRMDERGNLLIYKPSTHAQLVLSAHMDVVEPALDPHLVEEENILKTDGNTALGADDKIAVAAAMRCAEKGYENVAYLFTVAEEIGLYGSAGLTRDFLDVIDIGHIFVLDASGPVGSAIIEAPGKTRMELDFKGRSAHAGFEIEKGVNAIELASCFVTAVPKGRFSDGSTLNIGSFVSEGSTNVVPEKARVVLEIRAVEDSRLKEIEEVVMSTARRINPMVEIYSEHLYQGYRIDGHSPILEYISKKGIELNKKSTMGGSDASHLLALGYSTLLFSIGYEGAHSKNEHMEKKEIEKLLLLLDRLLC